MKETIDAYVCPEKQGNEYDKSKFTYDSERDVYICPQGRELGFYRKETKSDAVSRSIYTGNCSVCPKQSQCTRAKTGNRTISRDRYEPLREQMRAKLQTDAGQEIYRHRKELPEPVFGQVKQQQAFHQHLRRGLEGVNHEFGLSCLVYNIKLIWHKYTNYQGAREALSIVSL